MHKEIRQVLITELAKGGFVSGQMLGDTLGVSRAAITKHVRQLEEMGLDIFSVQGKGYKLAKPLNLLSQPAILSLLSQQKVVIALDVYQVIDSTNSQLMKELSVANDEGLEQGKVCISEYQSAGRGRRGRQWISPFGSHLYLSMYWRIDQGIASAMGLSVVTALAVSDAIKKMFAIDVQLKWPNDVYLKGKKLAGILIDLEGQISGTSHSVIGIGLNLNMPDKSAELITQAWTDLQSHVLNNTSINSIEVRGIDRNALCAQLIVCLLNRLQTHQIGGLKSMLDDWHTQDMYLNKSVKIMTGNNSTLGICRGINAQGALLLEVNKVTKTIYSGEVSLRGAE